MRGVLLTVEATIRSRVNKYRLTAANGGVAPTDKHNASTYSNWGCRCEECTRDHREQNARRRAERYQMTADNGGVAPVDVHNEHTYKNWGCRCARCMEAIREYYRSEAQRRRDRAQANR